MNTTNTIEAIREHLVLLGKELEFASGIRALAAEKIMSEQDITDPDDLLQACEDLVGSACRIRILRRPAQHQAQRFSARAWLPVPVA